MVATEKSVKKNGSGRRLRGQRGLRSWLGGGAEDSEQRSTGVARKNMKWGTQEKK